MYCLELAELTKWEYTREHHAIKNVVSEEPETDFTAVMILSDLLNSGSKFASILQIQGSWSRFLINMKCINEYFLIDNKKKYVLWRKKVTPIRTIM